MSHLTKYGTAYLGGASVPFAQEIANHITTILFWAIGSVPSEVQAAMSGLIGMAITGAVIVIIRKMQREDDTSKPNPNVTSNITSGGTTGASI